MYIKDHSFDFVNPEDFNEKTRYILPETWDQVQKSCSFFSSVIKTHGKDSFLPTTVVYNRLKQLTAIVTARPCDQVGKEDLYISLCEMLYLPASLQSQLFIVLTDTNVRDQETNAITGEALNMAFVASDYCFIFTIPYVVDDSGEVVFNYERAHGSSVQKNEEDDSIDFSAYGPLIELFFIFSHIDNTGPFNPNELLDFYDDNNIVYQIIDQKSFAVGNTILMSN